MGLQRSQDNAKLAGCVFSKHAAHPLSITVNTIVMHEFTRVLVEVMHPSVTTFVKYMLLLEECLRCFSEFLQSTKGSWEISARTGTDHEEEEGRRTG